MRYKELDSLRGLAAITVVIYHFLLVLPIVEKVSFEQSGNWFIKLIKFTPLHVFWSGHEAVLFFFVLSGFVLALPFLTKKEGIPYLPYLIKRICRIYLPYCIAVLVAIMMNYLFYQGEISQLSDWFNRAWQSPIEGKLVLEHFSLIGSFENYKFDPVLWSLVHEMRISIVFPIIMLIVYKFNWRICIGIALALGIGSGIINNTIGNSTDYFDTFRYIGLFIVGALLAKNRDFLTHRFSRLNKRMKYGLIVIALLAYTNSSWLDTFKPLKAKIIHIGLINEWGAILGVVVFIILSFSTKSVSNILQKKTVCFFGQISYSLYLYHAICLITCITIFFGRFPIVVILLIAFVITLIISTLAYYLVEIPSMSLGKYIIKKLSWRIGAVDG